MKKILILINIILLPFFIQSQTVSEKIICRIDNITEADGYSVKYDEKTGTYLYMYYDSTKQYKNMILSNKGNSDDYDYIDYFNAAFDKEGNYYAVANRSISDTSFIYSFLKNGKELISYSFINSELLEKNGVLYFLCSDNGKSFISSYNMNSGILSKGKSYREIIPCKFSTSFYEGEPYGKLDFTKSGKLFFLAKSDSKSFIVVGDEEKKHYADIDAYSILLDENDNFLYVAKDTGSFMYWGGNFVVYGDKEYKRFNSIFNLTLDKQGNPVYIAFESLSDLTPQKVISGNKVISKTYNGGIYNLGFTHNGKMYYVASEKIKNSEEYESFVVFDGKEGKRYHSVSNIKVTSEDELIYAVQKSENISAIVKGDREIRVKQSYLMPIEILENGSLAYIGVNYGNYDKKIKDEYYVNISGKEFGPYDGVQLLAYDRVGYFLSDIEGNYVYLVNNIQDFSEYRSVLYSNNWKSEEYDYILDVYLYKGKPIYTGSKVIDKDKYLYNYRLYYGSEPISNEYNGIFDFKFDNKTGIASFIVSKGNEIYKAEVKF